MLLFVVFCIATFNLAIGYAVGAGVTLGSLLDRLPRRNAKEAPVDIEDDQALTRPAPAAEAPEPEGEPEPRQRLRPVDVMAGLAKFREQLATTGVELKLSQDDPERFESSANKLQAANHAYLEQSEDALRDLGELGSEGDEAAEATKTAVERGAHQVSEISGKIDGLIESGLDNAEARGELLGATEEVRTAVADAESSVGETLNLEDTAPTPTPPAEPAEPAEPESNVESAAEPDEHDATALPSIDRLFEKLDLLLGESEEESVQHLAAFKVDPIVDHEEDSDLVDKIERQLGRVAQEILGKGQSFVPGSPTIALLEDDSLDEASKRVEKLRQQVEAITFQGEGKEVRATITCALADAHTANSREKLIEQLNTALDESSRVAPNSTYHHDGAFPTPVSALEVSVESKTVTL